MRVYDVSLMDDLLQAFVVDIYWEGLTMKITKKMDKQQQRFDEARAHEQTEDIIIIDKKRFSS